MIHRGVHKYSSRDLYLEAHTMTNIIAIYHDVSGELRLVFDAVSLLDW